uniref:ACB domain-containing protein n=2 Tax=Ascaris TaxID=6251 RepID=A0A0M3I394_ASCLU
MTENTDAHKSCFFAQFCGCGDHFLPRSAEMSLDEQFQAAVDIVQKLPKEGPVTTTTDEKLLLYSLYKQATIGKINIPQPAFYYITERYKWNAWNALADMSSDEAKEKYIAALLDILAKVSQTMDISEWLSTENVDAVLPTKFTVIGFKK